MHPGWQCCEEPKLLAWWVAFERAWVAERKALARAAYARGEHGYAWGVYQAALIRDGHVERVAEAHGVDTSQSCR